MMRINSVLFLGLIFFVACYNNSDIKNPNENVENNLFEDLNIKEKYINLFVDICSNEENYFSNFVVDDTITGLGSNFIKLFTYFDKSTYVTTTIDKFEIVYRYDNSFDAVINQYEYLYFSNGILINRVKNDLIYLIWKNKYDNSGPANHTQFKRNYINKFTNEIITNVDKNVIKEAYKYNGAIYNKKIQKLILKRNVDNIFKRVVIND